VSSPAERYAQDLQRPGFVADPAQSRAVAELERVHGELIARAPRRRLIGGARRWPQVAGLYLWGGVGRGKTHLMDAFYETLPFGKKQRTHFHRFMLDVHERRKSYPHEQDPLQLVANAYAEQVRVLCFDEFFVSDIADAMILGRLFEHLFARGVTLVATSNLPPERLYENGLQRANFLPFIDLLRQHVSVLNVDGGTDYRLRALTRAEIFHHPSDAEAEANLLQWFDDIAPEPGVENAELVVHERAIRTRRLGDGVVWFDFAEICDGPRSAADYVEIARTHHTVLLSKLPQLGPQSEDPARRFINLVDEFYDRGVKLIIAADVPMAGIYAGDKAKFEFQRTQSRLAEMASQEYLARPHLP
jgi:cell division protein ZapE